MNKISNTALNKANVEGILNIYSYIAHHAGEIKNGTSLDSIVELLEKSDVSKWNETDAKQFEILKNAVNGNPDLAEMKIGNQVREKNGFSACTFTDSNGKVSVVFSGTGKGEWVDNGQGLSGIPQENTYLTYKNGDVTENTVVDYATTQQVKALNWFNKIADENGWDKNTEIVLTGHSKGGNTAQFVTMNSDLVDECYSFDGQGFSPEAIESFKKKFGADFEIRRQKMQSFSSKDDFVNVLGNRLIPEDHIYFFEPSAGYDGDPQNLHEIHSMFDENGNFTVQCEQGEISKLIQQVSDEIMQLPPETRQYVTIGVMSYAQKILGKTEPVNKEEISSEVTYGGTAIVIEMLLENLLTDKTGLDALYEIIKLYDEDVISSTFNYFDDILAGENSWNARANAYITTAIVLILATSTMQTIGLKAAGFLSLVRALKFIGNKAVSLNGYFRSAVQTFFASITRSVEQWYYKNFSSGYYSATYNTLMQIDTGRMRYHAGRLDNIYFRLLNLDLRLKKLYMKTNLTDLFKVIQAGTMVEYRNKLRKCSKYLKDTADDFDAVENSITKLF